MTEASKSSVVLTVEDQRIIVSTLAYTLFDLMCTVAKTIKENETKDLETRSIPTGSESTAVVVHNQTHTSTASPTAAHESIVTLYRYAGAALHSMIEKRQKSPSSLQIDQELKYLLTMKIKKEEYVYLCNQVQSLDGGGLTIVSPTMIPFVMRLMEEINITNTST